MQERLPSYMIPSILVGLEALPRTTSGKTDRRRVLEDYVARSATQTTTDDLSPTPKPACSRPGGRCSGTAISRRIAVSSMSAEPHSRLLR